MGEIRTYTLKEAEPILKVTVRTIRDYVKSGKLKATKVGRSYVIKKEDIESFMNNSK